MGALKSKDAMLKGSPLKAIFIFMLPVLVLNLISQLYSLMDSVVVGQFRGSDMLAAISTTGPINFLILGFINGMATGFGLKIAQKYGAGNTEKVRKSIAVAIVLSLVLAIVMTIGTVVFLDALLQSMEVDPSIYADSKAYILVTFLGIIATIFNILYYGIVRGFGNSKAPLLIGILCSTINVILDLILVAWLKMPIYFAAVTNVFAQVLSTVLCVAYISKKYPEYKLTKKDFKINWKECWEQIMMGLPMALQFSITAIGVVLIQKDVNLIGLDATSGFAVGIKIENVLTTMMIALSVSISTFAAQNLGAQNFQRIRQGLKSTLFIGFFITIFVSFIAIVFGPHFTVLFLGSKSTPEIEKYAGIYLVVIGWFLWSLCLLFIYRTTLQSLNDPIVPTLGGVLELVARVVAVTILIPKYGYYGIAFAAPLAWVAAILILIPQTYLILRRYEKHAIPKVLLSNNEYMPAIGSGTNTFGKENNDFNGAINDDITPYIDAINNGYRMFDTAVLYRNENVLGHAIVACGYAREHFFITTKINNDDSIKTEQSIRDTVEKSLTNLRTDYIDLYLIHRPWDDLQDMLRVYKVLEEFVDAGKIISLGVSNFNITQLKYILENARIKPVVNQFESHPGNWNYELSEYCLANNVYPMAHSSIKLTSEEAKDKLHVIGDKYKKKWSQVILNYQLSLKMSVIPKSTSKKHQLRNMQILDFVLSPEDKAIIRNL